MGKLKYLVPNGVTAASLVLGLVSTTRSAAGDYDLAAWMIVWGVLLDKLDGSAARLLKASSGFGVQFDSFADFVVFGIAPASLVYQRLTALGAMEGAYAVLVWVSAGAYVLATAGRLARFNITTPPLGDRYFYGVPTTMMGAIVAGAYLTWSKYALDPALLHAAPALLMAGAVLMVSSFKLPKLKVQKSLVVNIVQFGIVAAAYVLGPLRLMPELLLSCGLFYLVFGMALGALFAPSRSSAPAPEAHAARDAALDGRSQRSA